MDILRALAILLIVFSHLPELLAFDSNPVISTFKGFAVLFMNFFAALGLALFFFVSGFVIHRNNANTATRTEVIKFFKKRILRIFPLYWIALGVYFLIFGILPLKTAFVTYNPLANNLIDYLSTSYSITDIAIYVVGLQGVLAGLITHPMPGLWFIGVVLVYYLIYPFINIFSLNKRKFIGISVILFALLVIVQHFTYLIDYRLFVYYGAFVGGIFTSNYDILSARKFIRSKQSIFKNAVGATCALAISAIGIAYVFNPTSTFSFSSVVWLVAQNVSRFVFALLLCYVVRLYIIASKKVSYPLLFSISFESYAVYLFHGPLLIVLGVVLIGVFHLTGLQIDTVLILLGVPSVFVVLYFVQQQENRAIRKITNYLNGKLAPKVLRTNDRLKAR
jgi:peptidoglycan/LPS O-acetylase OafA/YrhL